MAEIKNNTSVVEEENKDIDTQVTEINDNGNKDNTGESTGENNTQSEKTFTQTQVSKMMTKEKNQGRNAVYRELGINPRDTNAINALKDYIKGQKSEEQLKAEAEVETQNKISAAERRAAMAEAKAEVMIMGIKPQFVEDAIALALSKMPEDSDNEFIEDVKNVVNDYKKKYPIWFEDTIEEKEAKEKDKDGIGQRGTGSSVDFKNKNSKNDKGIGARLAAQRKTNKSSGSNKKSYWGH